MLIVKGPKASKTGYFKKSNLFFIFDQYQYLLIPITTYFKLYKNSAPRRLDCVHLEKRLRTYMSIENT